LLTQIQDLENKLILTNNLEQKVHNLKIQNNELLRKLKAIKT
ncbi:3436_t:CDS:1, partial [Racocetra persica]